ncbi:MAG: GNAT family N-acetyltransferase [Rhodothermales bacterium]|nr:GNAT family N-acetyltransferase [Rhodothermales bacterium]
MPAFPPVTLVGRLVRLEPLADRHLAALEAAAADPELWTFVPRPADTSEGFAAWMALARADEAAGRALVFATCLPDGTVIGSTRFANVSIPDGRAEIGWTFVGRDHQRTGVNREAKRLMLAHAFDTLGLERVEIKTDARNVPSRTAIAALGAVEEGTLRRHTRTHTGFLRDTVYFSILKDEWPAVRDRLNERLNAH